MLQRHRSIVAVFDHSWSLLLEEEDKALRRLSIFRSGFRPEAAEQVAEASFLLLASLVNKSLLRRDANGRYEMHQLLRQYAFDRLVAAREAQETHRRHLDFFLHLAEETEPKLRGGEQAAWLARLEMERDNFRSALQWSLEQADDAEVGLKLAGRLWWFWYLSGSWSEGRKWLSMPSRTGNVSLRAEVLSGACWLALFQGDYAAMKAFSEEGLALYHQSGDTESLALMLDNLGMTMEMQGDFGQAHSFFAQALELGGK